MGALLETGLSNAVMASVLAVLVAAISQVCRRPAFVHSLWLLVLLKLVTPPFFQVPLFQPSTSVADVSQGSISAPPAKFLQVTRQWEPSESGRPGQDTLLEAVAPVEHPDVAGAAECPESAQIIAGAPPSKDRPLDWMEHALTWVQPSWGGIVAPLWLLTSFLCFAWTGLQVQRFRRLLLYAEKAPAELQDQAKRLAKKLGLTRCPVVCLVPGAISPMLWAIGKTPCLLFPAELVKQLHPEQRATLLVHELAHLRRRDHWVRILEVVVLGLYWWHPIVWWARRELREAEEQCCDAWVVATLADADRAYATALLQTVAFLCRAPGALPVAASGAGQVRHLRRRLTMIMQARTPRSLSWVGLLTVLGLGLLLLPFVPVRAQQVEGEPKGKSADTTDEQINALKKALQILEDQKRAEKQKGDADKKANAAEIDKLRKEVASLAPQVEAKRRELQELEARHQNALIRLAQLEGKQSGVFYVPIEGSKIYRYEHLKEGDSNRRYIIQTSPDGKAQEFFRYSATPKVQTDKGKTSSYAVIEEEGWVGEQSKQEQSKGSGWHFGQSKEDKAAELEKKLDKVLKEVEELKRQLRQEKPQSQRPDNSDTPKNPYVIR